MSIFPTQDELLEGAELLQMEVDSLKTRFTKLESAARKLRAAQKNYMSNRGNQEAGKAVAVAARELDQVLGDV